MVEIDNNLLMDFQMITPQLGTYCRYRIQDGELESDETPHEFTCKHLTLILQQFLKHWAIRHGFVVQTAAGRTRHNPAVVPKIQPSRSRWSTCPLAC
jgi:hypothetical protein